MSTTIKSKAAKVRQITNKSKYTDLHTITNNLCSPACFNRKYYLTITQMTSTGKTYISYLIGLIIKLCCMICITKVFYMKMDGASAGRYLLLF